VMLCEGFCDIAGCSNATDYVEIAGTAAPAATPSCASFTPVPLDVNGATSAESASRLAYDGSGAAGLAGDWALAPASRD